MKIKEKVLNYIIDNWIDSVYFVGYRKIEYDFWEEEKSWFKLLKPTFRYWYADPIPYHINDRNYVFMEQYDRIKQIGYICVTELKDDGKIVKPKTIIKRATHMSFPMIVLYKNSYYMIPESSATDRIELYKMNGSVLDWNPYYSILLNEKMVDIAVEVRGEEIILLGGILNVENSLQIKRQIITIYNLDDLDKIDYKIGYTDLEYSNILRNAGNFFNHNNKLYLVTQESTEQDYGMYLSLNEVTMFSGAGIRLTHKIRKTVQNLDIRLNRYRYRKIGTHTYGKLSDKYEVIDVSATQLSIHPLLRKIKRKILCRH